MATGKFDVLPKKDMSRVKKDIKEIKKRISSKGRTKRQSSLRLIPRKDVKEVKRDLKSIKKRLAKTIVTKGASDKPARFDNYYDLMPHKRMKKLEKQVTVLKGMLKKKTSKKASVKRKARAGGAKSLERSMNQLSKSINTLIRMFEIAGKDPCEKKYAEPSHAPDLKSTAVPTDARPLVTGSEFTQNLADIKSRIAELSMENEQMAKGILVAVELLKEGVPMRKEEEKPLENPFERSLPKSEEYTPSTNMFDQGKESNLPPMPPLDDMPEAPTPGTQFGQDRRRSMF